MGVYVFRSLHGPYIKIGHYAKSNAWSRIAHRGFHKILHPKELRGKVSVEDFTLVYWNQTHTTKDEKSFHKHCASYRVIGEWFHEDALPLLQEKWIENQAETCNKQQAIETRRRL